MFRPPSPPFTMPVALRHPRRNSRVSSRLDLENANYRVRGVIVDLTWPNWRFPIEVESSPPSEDLSFKVEVESGLAETASARKHGATDGCMAQNRFAQVMDGPIVRTVRIVSRQHAWLVFSLAAFNSPHSADSRESAMLTAEFVPNTQKIARPPLLPSSVNQESALCGLIPAQPGLGVSQRCLNNPHSADSRRSPATSMGKGSESRCAALAPRFGGTAPLPAQTVRTVRTLGVARPGAHRHGAANPCVDSPHCADSRIAVLTVRTVRTLAGCAPSPKSSLTSAVAGRRLKRTESCWALPPIQLSRGLGIPLMGVVTSSHRWPISLSRSRQGDARPFASACSQVEPRNPMS